MDPESSSSSSSSLDADEIDDIEGLLPDENLNAEAQDVPQTLDISVGGSYSSSDSEKEGMTRKQYDIKKNVEHAYLRSSDNSQPSTSRSTGFEVINYLNYARLI